MEASVVVEVVEMEGMGMNKTSVKGEGKGSRVGNQEGGPTKLPGEGGGHENELGSRSPWWGGRKEGTSNLQHNWSQFLVGLIHPVWWHPPDDGRLCTPVTPLGGVCKARRSEES